LVSEQNRSYATPRSAMKRAARTAKDSGHYQREILPFVNPTTRLTIDDESSIWCFMTIRFGRISPTRATGFHPVSATARSERAYAIISHSRWYKKSVRSLAALDGVERDVVEGDAGTAGHVPS
jgi:hypothetical protein